MRAIKFRGKRIDTGKWVEGDLIHLDSRTMIADKSMAAYDMGHTHEYISLECVEVYPETVCQFTGLTDRNGIEIYEGDICKCRYYKHAEKDLYLTQKVVFEHASFYVVAGSLVPDIEPETYANCPLSWVDKIEVIANIHDNPELLKL